MHIWRYLWGNCIIYVGMVFHNFKHRSANFTHKSNEPVGKSCDLKRTSRSASGSLECSEEKITQIFRWSWNRYSWTTENDWGILWFFFCIHYCMFFFTIFLFWISVFLGFWWSKHITQTRKIRFTRVWIADMWHKRQCYLLTMTHLIDEMTNLGVVVHFFSLYVVETSGQADCHSDALSLLMTICNCILSYYISCHHVSTNKKRTEYWFNCLI